MTIYGILELPKDRQKDTPMANYIQTLQTENAQKDAELRALYAGLTELKAYLTSDKFADDNSVQVRDVLTRLHEAESAAANAATTDL